MALFLSTEVKNLCSQIDTLDAKKFKSKSNSLIAKFKNEWIENMYLLKLYNEGRTTYSLNFIEVTEYGFSCRIFFVAGCNFEKLDNVREELQDKFGCLILFKKKRASQYVDAKFIFNSNNDITFKLHKYKEPYVLYIGNDYSGQPIFIDMKLYPHMLITGGTRSGKSVMQTVILSHLIANFSIKTIELYLCQIAKSDLVLFEDAEQTVAFADDLDKTLDTLEYLVNVIMKERDSLIRPYRKKALASNYHDYNKITRGQKIKTSYLVFDEMASLYQVKGDPKCIKEVKERIIHLIDDVARYGASLGVFLISSLQRPTADNLSPMVKAQSTAIVSFRQNNTKSSEVATDDGNLALGLEQREFVYLLASSSSYGIVPWTKDIEAYQCIKSSLKPHHIDIFHIMSKDNSVGNKKKKEKVEFNNVTPKTKEQILAENIPKIKGFVPYEDITVTNKKGREKA